MINCSVPFLRKTSFCTRWHIYLRCNCAPSTSRFSPTVLGPAVHQIQHPTSDQCLRRTHITPTYFVQNPTHLDAGPTSYAPPLHDGKRDPRATPNPAANIHAPLLQVTNTMTNALSAQCTTHPLSAVKIIRLDTKLEICEQLRSNMTPCLVLARNRDHNKAIYPAKNYSRHFSHCARIPKKV
jgi:hypothetical protein